MVNQSLDQVVCQEFVAVYLDVLEQRLGFEDREHYVLQVHHFEVYFVQNEGF
jgi:hypothetical protein